VSSSVLDVDPCFLTFHRLRFIRHSLATCLLLYGCERNVIMSLEMITEDEIRGLPSRFVCLVEY
jgi:hypothetical protein